MGLKFEGLVSSFPGLATGIIVASFHDSGNVTYVFATNRKKGNSSGQYVRNSDNLAYVEAQYLCLPSPQITG